MVVLYTRRHRDGKKRYQRTTRKIRKSHCIIPILAHASNYSYKKYRPEKDFYLWVNDAWARKTRIPPFENDYGVSEEVEQCIFHKSLAIIQDVEDEKDGKDLKIEGSSSFANVLRTLYTSIVETKDHTPSVDLLQSIVRSTDCIQTAEDVFRHFSELSYIGCQSLLNIYILQVKDTPNRFCIEPNVPSLKNSYYSDPSILKHYTHFLKQLGSLYKVPGLERCIPFEKKLLSNLDTMYTDTLHTIRGSKLATRFPNISWSLYFEMHGIKSWKTETFYYKSPAWIHHIGTLLKTVPIDLWKLYIARTYCLNFIQYLPPPYNNLYYTFFQKVLHGQAEKTPPTVLLLNTVYTYLQSPFSELFWNKEGSQTIQVSIEKFTKHIVKSAKERISTLDWLSPPTRKATIEKINSMTFELCTPPRWISHSPFPQLDSKNLLASILSLAKWNMETSCKHVSTKHSIWDRGIFTVNAYYYEELNRIRIPYGTVYSPFYNIDAPLGWNHGAFGCILGHEMCHGFDEDGKEYDSKGKKHNWWKTSDNRAYNKKAIGLIKLFHKQHVLGKLVDGKHTLSENIADLGGVGISLYSLQEVLKEQSVSGDSYKQAIQTFFIAFAVSWRTKYRTKKLQHMLNVDKHSPAFLRVNLVVSQFDEWYEAFDIPEKSPYFIPKEKRIRIF